MKDIAKEIFDSLNPGNSIDGFLKHTNLDLSKHHLVGLGKPASFYLKHLNSRFDFNSLLSVVKTGHQIDAVFEQWQLDHPVVTKKNLEWTQKLKNYLFKLHHDEPICFLISGGASAMLSEPKLPWADFQKIWETMLYEGWPIENMNKVRILMDSIKGGGLLKNLKGQKVTNLYISDVPIDPFDHVSSAPTNPVDLEPIELLKIIKNFKTQKFQDQLLSLLERYQKPVYPVDNFLVESAENFLQSAIEILKNHFPDYDIKLDSSFKSETCQNFIKRIPELKPGSIFISLGEASVDTEENVGYGGRNSHLVALMQQKLSSDQEFFSLASDGNDGNTAFAGGWVDYRGKEDLSLNSHLDHFTSAKWLEQNAREFNFGRSQSNLMDLRVLVHHI